MCPGKEPLVTGDRCVQGRNPSSKGSHSLQTLSLPLFTFLLHILYVTYIHPCSFRPPIPTITSYPIPSPTRQSSTPALLLTWLATASTPVPHLPPSGPGRRRTQRSPTRDRRHRVRADCGADRRSPHGLWAARLDGPAAHAGVDFAWVWTWYGCGCSVGVWARCRADRRQPDGIMAAASTA
eukprot:357818-Chlamydomonas_euryale.AAC.2